MPGMKDIAEICGVSIKTVSNVINKHPNIKNETRNKVLAAIRQCGYVPNVQARALVMKSSASAARLGYNIGCVISQGIKKYQDTYTLMIFKGIEEEIRKQGYQLTFIESLDGLTSDPLRANILLSPENLDGIISFVGPLNKDFPRLTKTPVVMVGQYPGFDGVSSNKLDGIRLMVDYLCGQGHRSIGFSGSAGDGRFSSYVAELTRRGLACLPEWQLNEGCGFTPGLAAGERFAELQERPSAVICESDRTAIGFIHGLYKNNIKVPDDVSVTGYDDVMEAQVIYPPLTTVNVNKEGIGRAVVRALLERIANPEQEISYRTLPVTLVERASVRKLK